MLLVYWCLISLSSCNCFAAVATASHLATQCTASWLLFLFHCQLPYTVVLPMSLLPPLLLCGKISSLQLHSKYYCHWLHYTMALLMPLTLRLLPSVDCWYDFFLSCWLLQPLSLLAWLQCCQCWHHLHFCCWVDCWFIQLPLLKWVTGSFLVLPAPCHYHRSHQAVESSLQLHHHTIAIVVAVAASLPSHHCCHVIAVT